MSELANRVMGPLETNIERLKQGWRMVPREPTDAMMAAMLTECYDEPLESFDDLARRAWQAAFDAYQNQVTD